jgi:cytochrome c peroxidase
LNNININIKYLLLVLLFTLSGCSDKQLNQELLRLAKYHQIDGNPIVDAHQQVGLIESGEAQLGKLLFFSKTLSGQGDVACVSCHHPFLGGDDNLSLSIGVNPIDANTLGLARQSLQGEILVPRNSPTTFNSSLWQKHLFHDGRVERINGFNELPAQISTPDERFADVDPRALSLVQAQAGFPVTSEHEMRSQYKDSSSNASLRAALVDNLVGSVHKQKSQSADSITWRELFLNVYPQEEKSPLHSLLNFSRVQYLLGEYEKSQIFINTPWKKYLEGNMSELSSSAKKGGILFYKDVAQGGAGCVDCHTGNFFTDEEFHVSAFPHIGTGLDIKDNDTGRFLRTGVPDDRYAFRTPSLINVEITAPYGHNGAFKTLSEVIKYHLDPVQGIEAYDFSLNQLDQKGIDNKNAITYTNKALTQYQRAQKQGISKFVKVSLMEEEITQLIDFIHSLTDPCVKDFACLMPWVATTSDPNPDGQIIYIDN